MCGSREQITSVQPTSGHNYFFPFYRFEMRYKGKITHWNDDKGFGFITPIGGGQQVFVHIKSFVNRQRRPVDNERVSYVVKTDLKGRPSAETVTFVGKRLLSVSVPKRSTVSFIFAAGFLGFVAGTVFYGKLPLAVLWLYCISSFIAFVAYALDKSAARKGKWRTQESTLHFFALIGGWPGALIAQQLFRHKSKKKSFQIVFWATVVVNCGALGWLFSPLGEEVLGDVLRAL